MTDRDIFDDDMGAISHLAALVLNGTASKYDKAIAREADAMIERLQAIADELDRLREATRWRDAAKEWPEVGTRILFEKHVRHTSIGVTDVFNGLRCVICLVSMKRFIINNIKWWMPLPDSLEVQPVAPIT